MLKSGSPGSSTPSTDCSTLASPSSFRPAGEGGLNVARREAPSADFGTVNVSATSPLPSRERR